MIPEHERIGPVYGVALEDSLPIGGMLQALPMRSDLEATRRYGDRVAAGYEVLLGHYRTAIARAEAAEARVKELESRLAAMQWRPIAEYDAMAEKPADCLFRLEMNVHGESFFSEVRRRDDDVETTTHFLQLPPVTEGGE